jgi:cytochrome c
MKRLLLVAALAACAHTNPAINMAKTATTPEQQSMAGAKLYADDCAGCHGDKGEGGKHAPALIGPTALPLDAPDSAHKRKGVQFKTAADVFAFIKKTMPADEPGSLGDSEIAAILAYDLHESNMQVDKVLTAEDASEIVLHP